MSKEFDRKELRQDAFVDSSLNALDWIKKHQEKVVKFGSIIVIASLVVVIWRFQTLKAERAVSENLFSIMNLYRQGTPQADEEAVKLCQETSEAYAKSKRLDAVHFYEGNCLFRLEKFDESLKVYEDFIAKYPDHEQKNLIKVNMAYIYEEKRDYQKAQEVLTQLLEDAKSSYMRPKLTLDLARIEGLLNNPDKARELYERVMQDYQGSEFAAIAESQKDFL